MRRVILRILTWGTLAGAIASALWLSSGDPGWPEWHRLPAATLQR